MNKIGRLVRLPASEQWLLLQAVAWLVVARLLLCCFPFKRLAARLNSGNCGKTRTASIDREGLLRIGWAIRAAARHVPWRADCFPQAIAGRLLLRRRGIASTLYIGVAKSPANDLSGHAWLTCRGIVVTGGTALDHYTVLQRFA